MFIHVNGIEIYYETEGEGTPILLLHGNGEDHCIFDRLVKDLKKNYLVYMIDTRGHGRSGKVDSFHYSDMVEDVAAFVQDLDIKKPLIYGFSDGGIIGLMLAAKYPQMLSGLVASGVNLSPKDMKARYRLLIRLVNAFKRDPLLRLMLDEPNIAEEELERIEIPVLITVAEKDAVPCHTSKRIADKIPDGRLIVIPREDHGSYVIHSDKLFPLISDFIGEVSAAWASSFR